jgi:hypothetical protein
VSSSREHLSRIQGWGKGKRRKGDGTYLVGSSVLKESSGLVSREDTGLSHCRIQDESKGQERESEKATAKARQREGNEKMSSDLSLSARLLLAYSLDG